MKYRIKKHTSIEDLFLHNISLRYGEVTTYGRHCIWIETEKEYEEIIEERIQKLKSIINRF